MKAWVRTTGFLFVAAFGPRTNIFSGHMAYEPQHPQVGSRTPAQIKQIRNCLDFDLLIKTTIKAAFWNWKPEYSSLSSPHEGGKHTIDDIHELISFFSSSLLTRWNYIPCFVFIQVAPTSSKQHGVNVGVNASATPFQQASGYGSHGYSTGEPLKLY